MYVITDVRGKISVRHYRQNGGTNMKQVILSAILLLSFAFPSMGKTPNSKVRTILQAIQDSIRVTHSLSYMASYSSIDPSVEDSIYFSEGHVWLIRIPS